jgi:glycosyltransferase involved in cell wall biosynthesis
MFSNFSEGIAIATYNRSEGLKESLTAVFDTKPDGARVVVCDDGSTDSTFKVVEQFPDVTLIRGTNKGVGANKNRAIFALRNYDFITILEDDLIPTESGWFEMYREFCLHTNTHHFCRVQDKFIEEVVPDFTTWCVANLNMTPIYGPSPRGDFTFISNMVIRKVGAFHPDFVGVGHAHGQWSDRVIASHLVQHPNKWVDIQEAANKFKQVGDTIGGRWNEDQAVIQEQVKTNHNIRKILNEAAPRLYIEPFLP